MLWRGKFLHFLVTVLCLAQGLIFAIEPALAEQHATRGAVVSGIEAAGLQADEHAPTSGHIPPEQANHVCHCLHQHLVCNTSEVAAYFSCQTSDSPAQTSGTAGPVGVRPQLLRPPIQ